MMTFELRGEHLEALPVRHCGKCAQQTTHTVTEVAGGYRFRCLHCQRLQWAVKR